MLRKLLTLIGLTTVAAGVGAYAYKNKAEKEGKTFEEKLNEDREKLVTVAKEKKEVLDGVVVEMKKDIDKINQKVSDLAEEKIDEAEALIEEKVE